ncbi:MAG: MarR family winged helix-turn-helix transcriptional regulator [Peptococcaceae bacterium]
MKKSIGRLVSILHRQAQIYINYSLKEFNITSAEYSFLLYLYMNDGITQDELSSFLYIDKSATARAIKSLEEKGYVTKEKDCTDKRCNRIYLTAKARHCKKEIKQRVWRWSEFLTDGLDENTKETLLSVLEKMADKVEKTNLKEKLEES